jgi:hypothetical protein
MKDIKFDKKTLEGIIQTYYVFLKPLMYCYAAVIYSKKYRSIFFTIIIQLVLNLTIHISNWIGICYMSYLHSDKYKGKEIARIIQKYNIKESETLSYQIQHIVFSVMFYISTYKCMMFWASLLSGNITSTILLNTNCNTYSYGICFVLETFYEHVLMPFYIQNEYRRHLKIGRRCLKFDILSQFGYKLSIIIALINMIVCSINCFITGIYPFYSILSYPSYMSSIGLLVWIPCVYYIEKILINKVE